jgi:hypothetical protein
MKHAVLTVVSILVLAASAHADPTAVVAWFTDAEIDGAQRIARPADAPPEVAGSYGHGVRPTKAFAMDDPLLSQQRGYVSFWIRPNWNGNDGRAHRILAIGAPDNGLLVEKSAKNVLRFVMASPKKTTASRADVSNWKAGQWHHVVVIWMDREDKPLGLPIWIDRVAVAGPTAADNDFLNPETMADKRLWIGDASTDAVIDELICRKELATPLSGGQVDLVYRDYFRTAPYSAVRIDPEPLCVRSDRRVVEGHEKQFGLEGWLVDRAEDMTDFTARYGCWGNFDAKPFITWSTSDDDVATVDANGLVTGHKVGKCTLTAEFRGMKATYAIEVIPVEQPDLDLAFVERLPRYPDDRRKNMPEPGEPVQAVAHVINMGYKPVPAGTTVLFEMFPDANRNFRIDPDEESHRRFTTQTIKALEPEEEVTVTFPWTWPAEPVWIRVTVDPRNSVKEICEANNQRWFLSTARPMWWGYTVSEHRRYYDEKLINLVGSFSTYDWAQSQTDRLELMLRDAVYPSTSPDGVRDSIYLDIIAPKSDMLAGEGEYRDVEKKPELDRRFWDGGWPNHDINHPLTLDSGVIHELGHVMLALPDLYGYPMPANRVYINDENGKPYEGGPLMPYLYAHRSLPKSRAAGFVPCGVAYSSLMDFCHLWLDESNACKIQHYAGFRGHRFWGSQGHLIPTWENALVVYDVDDNPLAGAAVYVYHVNQVNVQNAGAKYFNDRPKFMGHTDQDGRYIFPKETDGDWDDPDTDEVDGRINVWNPFGRVKTDTAFTPNVWSVEGLLLIRIVTSDPVAGDQTEFAWLDLTDFNIAYCLDPLAGECPIRTSLRRTDGETPLVRPEIPEAIREQNLRPVAVIDNKEITVNVGEEFTLDGSKSYDPEDQPLVHAEWQLKEGHDRVQPHGVEGYIYKGTATKPGDLRYVFFVNDGVRASEGLWVTVHVKEADETEAAATNE